MRELIDLVDERFMPHGHCYFWEPFVLWSYAISDSVIALAYFSIPLALSYIYLKRKDFTYVWMVVLFAIFIAGCGITHVFDVINIWKPLYNMDVIARIITAVASIATAAVLIKFTPKIIDIPSVAEWKRLHEELQNVNEKLQAQIEELKEKDKTIQGFKEFERLTETLPQLVWTTNPFITTGNIAVTGESMYINRRWYEYTGLTEDKVFQDIFNECVLEQEDHYKQWVEQKNKRESYEAEVQIKRFDGQYRWHLHKASYIPQTNSWVGTFTDIHDQKLYNQELAEKNQQLVTINTDLDNFIYTASHDLKSPIVNLEGLTLALTKKLTHKVLLDEEQNRILSLMASSVNRLKSTIASLTEIAKAQKEDVEEEMVSIEKVVAEIQEDLGKQIRESQVKIYTQMEVDELKFAPKNIRSIIYNLLSNAIKYRCHQKTAQVRIETRKEGDNVVIRVEDNGIGISENHLQKLFTMFRRFHTHVEGTGIGLYIVKRIVENAGGKIEVKSKVDVGTTFSVYLPYSE